MGEAAAGIGVLVKALRVLRKEAAGASLPEGHEKYFIPHPNAQHIPLSKLRPTRARPEGIANAADRMRESAEGTRSKRLPLAVGKGPGGTYHVLDGNSTYHVAKASGWKSIPGIVVDPKHLDPKGHPLPGTPAARKFALPNG